MMVAFRFLLGIGFGPKSATIPIYASECAPANIRGALVIFGNFHRIQYHVGLYLWRHIQRRARCYEQ